MTQTQMGGGDDCLRARECRLCSLCRHFPFPAHTRAQGTEYERGYTGYTGSTASTATDGVLLRAVARAIANGVADSYSLSVLSRHSLRPACGGCAAKLGFGLASQEDR